MDFDEFLRTLNELNGDAEKTRAFIASITSTNPHETGYVVLSLRDLDIQSQDQLNQLFKAIVANPELAGAITKLDFSGENKPGVTPTSIQALDFSNFKKLQIVDFYDNDAFEQEESLKLKGAEKAAPRWGTSPSKATRAFKG